MLARIGVTQILNRHHVREFNSKPGTFTVKPKTCGSPLGSAKLYRQTLLGNLTFET
jgi:hypothetical protein